MQRFPVLNGLRGLAIIAVIFHHSFFPYILYGTKDGHPAVHLSPLIVPGSSGWLGVNLFLFLSGFVLYLPYANGQRAFDSVKTLGSFYGHRARRLLPLYYITTLIFLVLSTTFQLNEWGLYRAIGNYLLATFIFHGPTFFPPANWVLWSLGVEIWFSILFPAVVVALQRYGWLRVISAVLLLSVCVRIGGRMWLPDTPRPTINFLSDSLFGRLDEFLIGMLGACLVVKRRLMTAPHTQFIVGLALVAASTVLWAVWYRGHFAFPIAGFFNLPFDFGLLLTTNALLIGCHKVRQIICFWPLQMAGLMCYSLYLWHGMIITKYRPSAYTAGTYVSYLAITFAVSWLSYSISNSAQPEIGVSYSPARQVTTVLARQFHRTHSCAWANGRRALQLSEPWCDRQPPAPPNSLAGLAGDGASGHLLDVDTTIDKKGIAPVFLRRRILGAPVGA